MKTFTTFALTCALFTLFRTEATAQPVSAEDAELKWVVPADKISDALKKLGLDDKFTPTEQVLFFDTESLGLHDGPQQFILRARQKADKKMESTVKWRVGKDVTQPVTIANGKAEVDWTCGREPVLSWSENQKHLEGTINALTAALARDLFNADGQKSLISAAKVDVPWDKLRLYGPMSAQVWEDVKMSDYEGTVTVERWILQNGTKQDDILEISVKIKIKEGFKKDAEPFFSAAKKLSDKPRPASKTELVLQFFQPGK